MSAAATKNIFALLDSDDDEPVQKKAPVKATTTKNVPTAGKPVTTKNAGRKPAGKPTIVEPSKNTGVSRGSQHGERRRGARSNRGPRPDGEGGERRPRRDGERRAPRREFDRRSGTGRDKAIKKEGGGARNWGSNEAEAETANPEGEATEQAAATEEEAPAEEETPAVPEPKTFTLDEFRARQAAERAQSELFTDLEIRTVDDSAFADMNLKEKEEEESFFSAASTKNKRERARKTKNLVADVGFRAPPVERGDGRGERGDRRGPRGERGERRGPRGNRAPNVANANDFPTLG